MKNLLTIILNVFAFGLICFVSFIALRPISSANVTASSALPESVRASFNNDVSEVLANNQQAQLDMLVEQKKILQKIDANVSRLVGTPTTSPKLVEEKSSVEAEVMSPSPITTYRGIFRRGGVTRSPVSTAGK